MAHKNPIEDIGKSLVLELKGNELLPAYNAKKIADIAGDICSRRDELLASLTHLFSAFIRT